MRCYGANRRAEVDFVSQALRESGIEIVAEPPYDEAPFVWRVRLRDRRELRLVCYLFFANKYTQLGRGDDEHRFQIKYGQDLGGLHELYMPERRGEVTLMFGVHLERNIVIAVDPAMHNPTRFSVSVEFKEKQVVEVETLGWTGWERQRSTARRTNRPLENEQTEVVLGFTPNRFADYIAFEQFAAGLPVGERLLAIDRIAGAAANDSESTLHELEEEFGLTPAEILDVINANFRLKVAVRGSVAQRHLHRTLEGISGLRVTALDKDGQPDFAVSYRNRPEVFLECKNVLRRMSGLYPRVDFQRTRAAINNPCSRYYAYGEFKVLAACLHPNTQKWDFEFVATDQLPRHSRCEGRISERIVVSPDGAWTRSLIDLL